MQHLSCVIYLSELVNKHHKTVPKRFQKEILYRTGYITIFAIFQQKSKQTNRLTNLHQIFNGRKYCVIITGMSTIYFRNVDSSPFSIGKSKLCLLIWRGK